MPSDSNANGDDAPVTIDDPRAAKTLLDPRRVRYLRPFLAGPATLAEAARAAAVAPSTMHYQIRKASGLGLLTRCGTRPGRGRARPLYRAAARRWFVPFEATDAVTLRDLVAARYAPLFDVAVRGRAEPSGDEPRGVIVEPDDEGRLTFRILPSADRGWPTLVARRERLADEDATWLADRLAEATAEAVRRSRARGVHAGGGATVDGRDLLVLYGVTPWTDPVELDQD
jgi:hypothetical protein